MLYQRCPSCRQYSPIAASTCPNSKCQSPLPRTRRVIVIRFRTGPKLWAWKTLGRVSIEYAQKKLFEIQEAIAEDRYEVEATRTPTWGDITERFIVHLEARQNRRYEKATHLFLSRMTEAWGADHVVTKLHILNIQEFIDGLLRLGLKPSTTNRHLAAGRAAWNYALPDVPNPFSRVKAIPENNLQTEDLSDDERNRLLEAAAAISETLYQMVVVALATGLRRQEVAFMRRDGFDFERRCVDVTVKGGATRTVLLGPNVAVMLLAIPDNGTPFFWVSNRTGQPYREGLRRTWEKAKRLAGITRPFRFHGLRHAAACEVYAQTGSLKAVKEFLGHAQIQTTERYAHVRSETMRGIADVMDGIVLPGVLGGGGAHK